MKSAILICLLALPFGGCEKKPDIMQALKLKLAVNGRAEAQAAAKKAQAEVRSLRITVSERELEISKLHLTITEMKCDFWGGQLSDKP